MTTGLPGEQIEYRFPTGKMNLAEFIIQMEGMNSNLNVALLRKAYEFTSWAHRGQTRASGHAFLEHCLNVAFILAEQHLDGATVAVGLLHDVVEDTDVTIEDIRREFSDEIAQLVDGVTKLGAYQFKSRAEQQAEYFRKMLISMSDDIRIIIIKLADRLHNMRTLEFLPREKQLTVAGETRDIYAPLAHRFGMAKIKWELEDLSLKYVNPVSYAVLVTSIDETREDRERYISEISRALREVLEEEGLEVEISGRAKHFDSIYRKMAKRRQSFDEIFDLIAMRVITTSVRDCYHALGVIHSIWKPVADRLHDYVATPKANMYQSLHTTVVGPHGKMVEIQIRTHAMHHVAEYGIAAHWLYKEGKHKLEESDRQFSWLREVLDWQKEMTNPKEFLEYLKIDLFQDELFVFTPGGDLKHLPKGATTLDFAFAVHTDLGLHCSGTKIDGKLVPFDTELKSGDEVEVMTSTVAEPSWDWLNRCHTSAAHGKIRRFLRQKGFEESLRLGKEMFDRGLKKQNIKAPPEQDLVDTAMALNFQATDQMFSALGRGDLDIKNLMDRMFPEDLDAPPKRSVIKTFVDRARGGKGIRVHGMGNMMFRFAKCCQPVPGDKILGFITRGRGLSIHRVDCSNAVITQLEPERAVEVEWDVDPSQGFLVRLAVTAEYRKNIVYELTEVIANADADVRGAELRPREGVAEGSLVIEIRNLSHLNRVIGQIRKKVRGIIKIERAFGGEMETRNEDEIGE